jgi:hypothetical protein
MKQAGVTGRQVREAAETGNRQQPREWGLEEHWRQTAFMQYWRRQEGEAENEALEEAYARGTPQRDIGSKENQEAMERIQNDHDFLRMTAKCKGWTEGEREYPGAIREDDARETKYREMVQKEDIGQHERTYVKYIEKPFLATGRREPADLWNAEVTDQQGDHPVAAKKRWGGCSEERRSITFLRADMLVKDLAVIRETAENNWESRVQLMPGVYREETVIPGTVDRHGDPFWSEEHKDITIGEEMRRTKEAEHKPRELRRRWQESKTTLKATKQYVKEERAKTTAMIKLMWGWGLARELT